MTTRPKLTMLINKEYTSREEAERGDIRKQVNSHRQRVESEERAQLAETMPTDMEIIILLAISYNISEYMVIQMLRNMDLSAALGIVAKGL